MLREYYGRFRTHFLEVFVGQIFLYLHLRSVYKELHADHETGLLTSVVCYTLCRRCCENEVAAGSGKGI